MWRRVYVSFPQAAQVHQVVSELEKAGMARSRMHTLAKPGVDIAGLPVANRAQSEDQVWRWEQLFSHGNLALLVVAALGVGLAMVVGALAWAVATAAVAIAAYVLGERFAVRLPHAHLSDMRVSLLNGEVVLLVDVPRHRVREIEELIGGYHEAFIGGVGWTILSAGS